MLDIRTTKELLKSDEDPLKRQRPNQGVEDFNKNVLQKVIQGPFKVTSRTAYGVLLAATPGISYFIHSVVITARNIVTDTCTGISVDDGTTFMTAMTLIPSAVNCGSLSSTLDVLMSEGLGLNVNALTASPTSMYVVCTYTPVSTQGA